eukprot:TRINITY_DN11812_c0_g1_i1.p1 TRINITY_DN11812_c0_g1~~TRINITY_DN11812_c0_g1_i1.p1  ORF type:complete len:307 (-),score=72.43 TRINITY_DN11812_c0_g1_i1:123-1043(-)
MDFGEIGDENENDHLFSPFGSFKPRKSSFDGTSPFELIGSPSFSPNINTPSGFGLINDIPDDCSSVSSYFSSDADAESVFSNFGNSVLTGTDCESFLTDDESVFSFISDTESVSSESSYYDANTFNGFEEFPNNPPPIPNNGFESGNRPPATSFELISDDDISSMISSNDDPFKPISKIQSSKEAAKQEAIEKHLVKIRSMPEDEVIRLCGLRLSFQDQGDPDYFQKKMTTKFHRIDSLNNRYKPKRSKIIQNLVSKKKYRRRRERLDSIEEISLMRHLNARKRKRTEQGKFDKEHSIDWKSADEL